MTTSDSDSNASAEHATEPAPVESSVVGGFAFFLSLGALLPTGLLLTTLTFFRIGSADLEATLTFVIAGIAGAVIAHLGIKGHISVLIHEFKHSLVSNLVGNKYKGMKIEQDSGYFQYAYTKSTAHYNAFISLAPYIVPVFTFLGTLLALTFFRHDHTFAALSVGVGYGVDLVLNIRDISPIQTDLSLIRGGYYVGLLYIIAWNLMIMGSVCAWVFHGFSGHLMMLEDISACFLQLYISLFGDPRT